MHLSLPLQQVLPRHHRQSRVVKGFLFLILLLLPTLSHAAQYGIVRATQARILQTPGGAAVEQLNRGTRIVIANQPTGGYFKTRTPSGRVGFIAESDVYIPPTQGQSAGGAAAQPQQQSGASATRDRTSLRILAGGALWSPTSALAVTLLASSSVLAYHFGLELDIPVSKSVFIPIRAEYLTKALSADSGTAVSAVTFSGIPIYAGIGARFGNSEKLKFRFAALGGYAPIVSMTATETYASASWVTTLSGSGISFAGLVGAELKLGQSGKAGVALDVGYRYLTTSAAVPTSTAATTTTTLPDGTIVDRSVASTINLSGLMAELALVFRF